MRLIASCVHRKTIDIPLQSRIHRYEHLQKDQLLDEWVKSIRDDDNKVPISRLYKSRSDGYWEELKRIVVQHNISCSVMSAGLGLVDFTDKAPAYSARFARVRRNDGTPSDLIPDGTSVDGRRWWWRKIGGQQKLQRLIRSGESIVILLPEMYLEIIIDTIIQETQRDESIPITIFTSLSRIPDDLDRFCVRLNKRMHRPLGGNGWTNGALTVLAAKFVLDRLRDPHSISPQISRLILRDLLSRSSIGP